FPERLSYTFNCQIVTLGRARGEDDFFRVRANELCDLVTRGLDCLLRFPPKLMATAGGIPKFFREVREHRLQDSRIGLGCGVIVQIDGQFHGDRLCAKFTAPKKSEHEGYEGHEEVHGKTRLRDFASAL